ncbi:MULTISPECIES: type II secretion system protein [unclassified Pyramidobacter]|uniref:type II secretion system protein n=1 Tax=unclassified Pyramidobacter TaxID=2632171 RepID=UPI0009902700|nr:MULTISPECIES: prepilin-type N-terminal cleavage/methylation domain-containing protein [unclassified Pyramidobacter]MDY3211818.1 prepilin-type N-terminal cleavage/methylation domain-containing protein [Pyramidobacter sp.]OON87758.1 hypothetical protein B0D78_09530 [Pyramidobacter sp. C12-8]RKJ77307.1 hypothetical protein D7D26_09010 [Pyramidobacter sp. CG50-2]WOL41155.1 prepilin-type N-terminal cleavage/methylation domain-containing protein [Pyramidobacter sp. YE332]
MTRGRRRKAFSLAEVLIGMAIVLTLSAGLFNTLRTESVQDLARRDMDDLMQWLDSAIARADRWRCSFYLSVYMPSDLSAPHFMTLRWLGRHSGSAAGEKFSANVQVRWRLNVDRRNFTYRWQTHTITPAFTVTACEAGGKNTGESLKLSLRGLLTRTSSR